VQDVHGGPIRIGASVRGVPPFEDDPVAFQDHEDRMGQMTSQPKKLNAGSNSPNSTSDGTGSVPHEVLHGHGS
jgi:hypothetical protein